MDDFEGGNEFRSLSGDYYQVDPIALRSQVNTLTNSARDYLVIDSPDFGEVRFVSIGATDVGTVQGRVGVFQSSGSSTTSSTGESSFDEVRECSKHCIQASVSVSVGMGVGEATQPQTGNQDGQGAWYAEVVKED
ncbi:hypothetical protein BS50DRAFT_640438 [Corynespora cassiicola Philippines]|uniref:Uncharacterized protein n=1 Tax=Corynespora cassiicola Philippines TaxID=1448308 RepID=A0A2T2N3H6_CORCC|nr:hypothetical protein BS50DRAFT_640438 [Corynespora cassiicola Philippines]